MDPVRSGVRGPGVSVFGLPHLVHVGSGKYFGGSKTQVTGQVRSQVRSQVTGQVTGQVTRKNIFLPRKLTIFNSKLTRYEKESVIMRGIVYFKLQDVALCD